LIVVTPVGIGGTATLDGYTGHYSFITGTTLEATYRIYETLEFEDAIGEVSFDLEAVTVSVTERKLRAQWSPELAQDVSAFHNIDAEAELTALLSEQVAAEIDREILRDLKKRCSLDIKMGLRWLEKVKYYFNCVQPKGLESDVDYCNQSDFCTNP
jgi:hypothetical protein